MGEPRKGSENGDQVFLNDWRQCEEGLACCEWKGEGMGSGPAGEMVWNSGAWLKRKRTAVTVRPGPGGSAGVEVGMQEPQSLRTNHEMEGGAGGAV